MPDVPYTYNPALVMMPPIGPRKNPYRTKLPRCMTPGCSKAATHGNVSDRDTVWRWCTDHREPQHILLIDG